MRRRCTYLRRNSRGVYPQRILIVDVESHIHETRDGLRHSFRLGHAMLMERDHGRWMTELHFPFRSIEEFHTILDSLETAKARTYIYAHNAAYDYGMLAMDTYWSRSSYMVETWLIATPFIVRATRQTDEGQHTYIFTDTMNYFKRSLAELAPLFGSVKFSSPDFGDVDDLELAKYCMQDVIALGEVVKGYIDYISVNQLGGHKLTIAAQAMAAFQTRFLPPDAKLLIHDREELLDMEMKSYRGGRTEAFTLGTVTDVYKLDVNSMYPYIMHGYPVSTRPLSRSPVEATVADMEEAIKDGKHVLAEVTLNMVEPAIGIRRDKLLFPTGRFCATLTHPELEWLTMHREAGEVLQVHSMAVYEAENVFRDYVDYFYAEKLKADEEGNEARREMAKLFLNSLYGKFGQLSGYEIVSVHGTEAEVYRDMMLNITKERCIRHYDGSEFSDYVLLGDDVYKLVRPVEKKPAPRSMPIISSEIAARARMHLYDIIRAAGLENCHYCDTDSVVVNAEGLGRVMNARLYDPSRLGALKLEDDGTMEIRGAKNYSFNDDVHIKGIRKDAQWDASRQVWVQDQWVTKKTRYKLERDGEVHVNQVEKALSTEYDKGVVDQNGRVLPFVLSERYYTYRSLDNIESAGR